MYSAVIAIVDKVALQTVGNIPQSASLENHHICRLFVDITRASFWGKREYSAIMSSGTFISREQMIFF